MSSKVQQRILLKFVPESLSSQPADPFDPQIIEHILQEILKRITDLGVEVALVNWGW
jgi:uridylate kinase